MSEDPILLASTASALILIPIFSKWLSLKKLKYVFIPPILALVISFPLFVFLVIVQNISIGRYLFYISMSLWTGGFFAIFISLYIYKKNKKK